uniref:Uncharacterized protein n=1 Tax=Glossina brevipalpis TaxID=37001 RepID=A0A1A9WVW4_9MUSC
MCEHIYGLNENPPPHFGAINVIDIVDKYVEPFQYWLVLFLTRYDLRPCYQPNHLIPEMLMLMILMMLMIERWLQGRRGVRAPRSDAVG